MPTACLEWPSREGRDEGNRKVMADPRMSMADMPFDARQMIYGGFRTIVDTTP